MSKMTQGPERRQPPPNPNGEASTTELTEDGLVKSSPSVIFTASGGTIDPIAPAVVDINIFDIAHALSNQCRWTGHTSRFYSVAEHSVLVSLLLERHGYTRREQLTGLLHDASEAYMADLARPIKKSPTPLGAAYLDIEGGLEKAIGLKFDIPTQALTEHVKWADDQLLKAECQELVKGLAPFMPPPSAVVTLFCWTPEIAKRNFLARYQELTGIQVLKPREQFFGVKAGLTEKVRLEPPSEQKPTNPKDALGTRKLPLSLFPAPAVAYGALAMLDGALKYGRQNWRPGGVRASVYVDAAIRHITAWNEGEDVDPDSGVPHLAHGLACLGILVDAIEAGNLTDDRSYPTGQYRAMVERMTPMVVALQEKHADKTPKHYGITDKETT